MSHRPDAGAFPTAVDAVVTRLGPGEIMTYGEVAAEAGYPGAARAVGNHLRTATDLPWWRIVTASGRLVPGHEHEQARRLRAEAVRVVGRRVSLSTQHAPRRDPTTRG